MRENIDRITNNKDYKLMAEEEYAVMMADEIHNDIQSGKTKAMSLEEFNLRMNESLNEL